jgi:hypothetical protein
MVPLWQGFRCGLALIHMRLRRTTQLCYNRGYALPTETAMHPSQDPARARLLAARLGELAALGRQQLGQATLGLPFIVTQLRRHVAERRQARDKLKANEFLAGG